MARERPTTKTVAYDSWKDLLRQRLTPIQSEVLFALWRAEREGRSGGSTYEDIFERLKSDAAHELAKKPEDKNSAAVDATIKSPSLRMIKKTMIQLSHFKWPVIIARPSVAKLYQMGRIPTAYTLSETGILKSTVHALLLVELMFSPEGDALNEDFLAWFGKKTGLADNEVRHVVTELELNLYMDNRKSTNPEFPVLTPAHRASDELPYITKVASQWNPNVIRHLSIFST